MDRDLIPYLDAILDTVQDGVNITDRNCVIRKVNRMYEQLSGFRAEDIVGRDARTLVSDGSVDLVLNPEIVATGRPITRVQRYADDRCLVLDGRPVFDKDGKVTFVVTFLRDETLLTRLRKEAEDQQKLVEQYQDQLATLSRRTPSPVCISISPAMRELFDRVRRQADSDIDLLLLGETGVGKDVLARLIHEWSSRRDHVFIKVDCASLPDSLTESELFGHAGGAFTGAGPRGRAGYFEAANGGTIFLDEVGELSPHGQARLLRVLQDREVFRVGSTKPCKLDVRILSATNRDLHDLVEKGLFRRDLYYRLNASTICIPPLRERKEDISLFATFFLDRYNARYAKHISLSPSAIRRLREYAWPGNVRELEHIMHNLVVVNEDRELTENDLPEQLTQNTWMAFRDKYLREPQPLKEITKAFERDFLLAAINRFGSINRVAQTYAVSRVSIFRKLRASRDNQEHATAADDYRELPS